MSSAHPSLATPTKIDDPSSAHLPRVIASADLLHGAREIHIQHGHQVYRLRVTKAGKLILNK